MVVIICLILWFILSTVSMIEYIVYFKDLKDLQKLIFVFVFVVGGPIFGINQILTALLDCILPEGWDKNDFN